MQLVKLQDVVSVSGYPGLYRIIGRSKTGIIVESMDTAKKRMSVSLTAKVSVLNEIAMYSRTEDVNLGVILMNLKQAAPTVPGKNAQPADLKKFMSVALPDYDEDRVYPSHIQKLANWYQILVDVLDYDDLKSILNPEAIQETPDVSDTPEEESNGAEKKVRKTKKKEEA